MSRAKPVQYLPEFAQLRTRAWALSVAIHLVLLGFVFFLGRSSVRFVSPPIRLIFVEPLAPELPVPPPPPLAGAAAEKVQVVEPLPIPPVVVEKPVEQPKPRRPVIAKKVLQPQAVAPPVQSGVSPGVAAAVAGGEAGGEPGGQVGGRVGGRGDAPVPEDQVEHPPSVRSRVMPVYPSLARVRGIEGRVVLRAVIDRDGRVEPAIEVVESMPQFDAAAIEALRQWRFQAGRDAGGAAVRVTVEVPMRFQLR